MKREACEKGATWTDWGFHLVWSVSLVPPVLLNYPAGMFSCCPRHAGLLNFDCATIVFPQPAFHRRKGGHITRAVQTVALTARTAKNALNVLVRLGVLDVNAPRHCCGSSLNLVRPSWMIRPRDQCAGSFPHDLAAGWAESRMHNCICCRRPPQMEAPCHWPEWMRAWL